VGRANMTIKCVTQEVQEEGCTQGMSVGGAAAHAGAGAVSEQAGIFGSCRARNRYLCAESIYYFISGLLERCCALVDVRLYSKYF